MKIRLISTFIFGGLALAVVSAKPQFCGKFDCPNFVTQSSGSHDVRLYGETRWLSTSVQSDKPWCTRQQLRSMFFKLRPYFNGENTAGRPIDMAVPALQKIERRGVNDYFITLMFYLADNNPPTPTGSGISVVTKPAGEVFISNFQTRSWPKSEVFVSKFEELKTSIGDSSLYNADVYYRAGYNHPFGNGIKHHEVWIDKL